MLEFLSQVAVFIANSFLSIGQACQYIMSSVGWLTSIMSFIPQFIAAGLLASLGIFLLRFILLR